MFLRSQDEAAAVSLEAVAEAVGAVKEVHFVLFGRDMLEEYNKAARGIFGEPLPVPVQEEEQQLGGGQQTGGDKPEL